MKTINVQELKQKIDNKEEFILIDVREPREAKISSIEGALLIPLDTLPGKLNQFDKDKDYVIHCRSGGRSGNATDYMTKEGFKNVKNLVGGINEWVTQIDPSQPTY